DDKRPRSFRSAGTGRSAIEPQTDPEKQLERQFVSDVAARLEKLRASKSFDRLIVSAGPRALGYWREEAPKELAAAVRKELAADHVRTNDSALVAVVEQAFFN
ncbi:MAG: host attachment protein, partial [Amphiplicatus sp.]